MAPPAKATQPNPADGGPPPGDAGTPTMATIHAGEFCKQALRGTYVYDAHGNLLYCGPVGATHPRWSHA